MYYLWYCLSLLDEFLLSVASLAGVVFLVVMFIPMDKIEAKIDEVYIKFSIKWSMLILLGSLGAYFLVPKAAINKLLYDSMIVTFGRDLSPPPPKIVEKIVKVDRIVEKPVEKIVVKTVEKPVYIEKVKVVEKQIPCDASVLMSLFQSSDAPPIRSPPTQQRVPENKEELPKGLSRLRKKMPVRSPSQVDELARFRR